MKPVVDVVSDDAGKLFGVLTSGTSESLLLQIDPETGAATTIGPMGVAGIMALASRGVVTEVRMPDVATVRFRLSQNYPNPFNPSTTIKYELPKSSEVRLSVFDMLGREVSVLVNERRDAGVHEVKFGATGLSSGVYFYRLHAGDFVQSKRMLVLK